MLTINIGWEWALGILGLLILMAWNGSARFTALETSMEWVKRTLNDLKIAIENGGLKPPTKSVGSPHEVERAELEALLREEG